MARYSQRDQVLLTEAYTLQLLKESMPDMSLRQVNANIDLMCESEAEFVCEFSERIINEFFGGLKNVAKGIGQGVQRTAQGVGNAIKKTTGGIGAGVASAGRQVIDNAKDMYNSGEVASQSASSVEKAKTLTTQLQQLLQQAIDNGTLEIEGGTADNIPLGELVDTLISSQGAANKRQQMATDKGFTGGIKQAFKKGRQDYQPPNPRNIGSRRIADQPNL